MAIYAGRKLRADNRGIDADLLAGRAHKDRIDIRLAGTGVCGGRFAGGFCVGLPAINRSIGRRALGRQAGSRP